LALPAASVYVFLVDTLPDRSGLGAVEFVHRALGNSPAYTLNWWQTLGPSWLTAPYANKVLLLAGLAAVAGAAIIGRAGRATREPADPQAA
jgi:putative exporter of polyketide antibiotics